MKDQIKKESVTLNRNQKEALKEVKDAITEMKVSIQIINNRLDHMENRISFLEGDLSENEHIVYNLEKQFDSLNWTLKRSQPILKEQT